MCRGGESENRASGLEVKEMKLYQKKLRKVAVYFRIWVTLAPIARSAIINPLNDSDLTLTTTHDRRPYNLAAR